MRINLSLDSLLAGVYADAAMQASGPDAKPRPAVLRREHAPALKRLGLSAWGMILSNILPKVHVESFTFTQVRGSEVPDDFFIDFTGDFAESHSGELRRLLETALERLILALAYGTAYPSLAEKYERTAMDCLKALADLSDESPAAGFLTPWSV